MENSYKKKKYMWAVYYAFLMVLGLSMAVFGEYDDSPGGMLIGLVMALAGLMGLITGRIRFWRK